MTVVHVHMYTVHVGSNCTLAEQCKMCYMQLTLMNSQPASSATIVGTVKGNDRRTPFSVPTHRALWAGIRVDTWIGIRLSFPNTVCVCVFGEREVVGGGGWREKYISELALPQLKNKQSQ